MKEKTNTIFGALKATTALAITFFCISSYANTKFYGRNVKRLSMPPSVQLKEPPRLLDKNSFSVILLGDPQGYQKYESSQGLFDVMTAWTAQQKETLNVMTVLCTGDLVDSNSLILSNGSLAAPQCSNQPSSLQWKSVSKAFERLDNVYPYIIATGNHDYGIEASESKISEFPKYFDVSRNQKQWANHIISYCPSAFGESTLENAAYEFYDKNWGDMLFIAMEFSPRDEVLEWANKLCASKKFKNHKIFVITHSILENDGSFRKDNYPFAPNDGKAVFEKLLKKHSNIKLAICGHTCTESVMAAFRKEKKDDGKTLPIMMFNPQFISGALGGNGGNGWLRILEFKPDGKTISVRTYSPVFAFSQKTEHLSWEKSPEHQFDIVIE